MDCVRAAVCIKDAANPSRYAAVLKYCASRGYLVMVLAADWAGATAAVLAGTADIVVAESRAVITAAPFEVVSLDLSPYIEVAAADDGTPRAGHLRRSRRIS